MKSQIEIFFEELNAESIITRKMLERIPNDKYDWKPHEKSMDIRRLATHIAELPTWITTALTTEELDFEKSAYEPKKVDNTEQLMAFFEKSLIDGRSQLIEKNEDKLDEMWTMRSGDVIYNVRTKAKVIRMSLSQIIHHRAQMGVFLRLLNIPIPGSYGPSADES